MPLLVGDEDKEDDEADDGDDDHDDAAEQAGVGMAAVHAVLLMPRHQKVGTRQIFLSLMRQCTIEFILDKGTLAQLVLSFILQIWCNKLIVYVQNKAQL